MEICHKHFFLFQLRQENNEDRTSYCVFVCSTFHIIVSVSFFSKCSLIWQCVIDIPCIILFRYYLALAWYFVAYFRFQMIFISRVFFFCIFHNDDCVLGQFNCTREKILSQTKHVEHIFILRLIVSYDKEITNVICYSLWSLLFAVSSYLIPCLSTSGLDSRTQDIESLMQDIENIRYIKFGWKCRQLLRIEIKRFFSRDEQSTSTLA